MCKNVDKIAEVAYSVRKWAELIYEQTKGSKLYGENLCGLCAIASAKLFTELKAEKIDHIKIVANKKHCFIITDDNYVVDVTATQFGFKQKVLIEPHDAILCTCPTSGAYDKDALHDNILNLRSWQLDKLWPYHQVVKYPLDKHA